MPLYRLGSRRHARPGRAAAAETPPLLRKGSDAIGLAAGVWHSMILRERSGRAARKPQWGGGVAAAKRAESSPPARHAPPQSFARRVALRRTAAAFEIDANASS